MFRTSRKLSKKTLLGILILLASVSIAYGENFSESEFKVFDSIQLLNKPDLTKYGLYPIALFDFSNLWKKTDDKNQLPNKTNLLNLVQGAIQKGRSVICLDIEHWPLTGSSEQVADTVTKMSTIIKWIKSTYPEVQVGFYGTLPIRNYWRAIKGPDSDEYKSWQKENDQLKPLADVVDIVFPSVYTFYKDREGWGKYAIAQINEARRYGKPVFAFVWPYYHRSNWLYGTKPLDGEYWWLELETLRQIADGIVIWTSANAAVNNPNGWANDTTWWNVTRDFMQAIKEPNGLK